MGAARGIIVEGIPGTGKSTLIRAVQSLPSFCQRDALPCLIFGEEMTQRTLERGTWEGTLTAEDHFQLLFELLTLLERQQERFHYRGWDGTREKKRIYYLLERFHLTHSTYYPYLLKADFSSVEERLLQLDARGCLLVMDRSVMKQRIIESRHAPAWHKYISRYGENAEQIVDHYCRQQQLMQEYAERSRLPWLVLDTTGGEWDTLACQLLQYWFHEQGTGNKEQGIMNNE